MKNYYGFAHNFGSNMSVLGAPHGDGGRLHIFDSKKTRDNWVSDGPAYIGDRGARISYSEKMVRAHVVTGEYGESDMTTRELVDQACDIHTVEDCR